MKSKIQKCSFRRVLPDLIVKAKKIKPPVETLRTLEAVKIKRSKEGHAETDK